MKFFEFLQKALSESPEEPSEMRVKTFFIAIVLTLVIAAGFVYTFIFYPNIIIPYLGIIAGMVGGSAYFKYKQKTIEVKQ